MQVQKPLPEPISTTTWKATRDLFMRPEIVQKQVAWHSTFSSKHKANLSKRGGLFSLVVVAPARANASWCTFISKDCCVL